MALLIPGLVFGQQPPHGSTSAADGAGATAVNLLAEAASHVCSPATYDAAGWGRHCSALHRIPARPSRGRPDCSSI